MRRLQSVLLAAVAIISFGPLASAADMPVKTPVYKTPVAAPAAFTWTGCYVGAHAGYGWGNKDWQGITHPTYLWSNFNVDGGLLGGQLGCNYQFASNWVVGIEASAAAANIKGSGIDAYTSPLYTDAAKMTSLGSLTGRLGWNGWNPQHLFYAKGGWAWARDEYTNSCCSSSDPYTTPNQSRSGWTVGAGWEWAFARNWSVFLEYDYYDFGNKTSSFTDPLLSTYLTNIKQTVETVKVGVNYHFDFGKGPVVTKY